MDASLRDALELAGGIAAAAAMGLTLLWLGIMARIPPPSGEAAERWSFYGGRRSLLYAHFLPSMFVAIAYVPIWIGLAAHLWDGRAALGILAAVFGVLYVPFALIGYSLQVTVARAIAGESAETRARWAPTWEVLSFSDAPESAAHWLVVLGYAVWGIGAAFAAAGLVVGSGAMGVATGSAFASTAALTWIGAAGVVTANPRMGWAVVASGVASVAATGLAAALLLG